MRAVQEAWWPQASSATKRRSSSRVATAGPGTTSSTKMSEERAVELAHDLDAADDVVEVLRDVALAPGVPSSRLSSK